MPGEFMNRAYSLLTIKSIDDEKRIIEGVATTPSTDRTGDIVEPEGAQYTLPLPLLYQHNSKQPIGHVISAKVTKAGITIRAQIAQGVVPFIDEAWALIKAGLIRGLSIGFKPIEYAQIEDSYAIRFIKWDWLELSAVTIAANADASITTIKAIDDEILRAASGDIAKKSSVVRLTPIPGAPGQTVAKKHTPKDKHMKTYKEQIAAFEASRQAKDARRNDIMSKAADEGRTLEDAESQEYDELDKEIKGIDAHLVRLHALETANVTKTVAVTVEAGNDPLEAARARAGTSVVTSVKQNVPKGTAFTRYAMALARSKGDLMLAHEISKQWHDSTPEVETVLKAAVAAGTTTDATWASPLALPNTMASEFVELLRPATIIGRIPGLRRIPFNVRMPRTTAGSSAGWVGQGAPKPVSRMSFDTMTMAFTKVAAIIVLTDELVRFSTPSAEEVVRNDMIAAISQYIDQQFIDPAVTASAGVRPASITNGLATHGSSGATIANVDTDVATLMGGFFTGNITPSVWIMNPRTAFALSQLRTANDVYVFPGISAQGGTFQGLPVITSNNVPINTAGNSIIILMDASEIFLADDGGVTLDVSREASLQMDGAPSAGAQAVVSLWQNNMVGLRAERFINYQRRRDAAVAVLTSVPY